MSVAFNRNRNSKCSSAQLRRNSSASVENLQNIGIRRRSLSNSRRGSIEHLSVCNQNVQMHRRIWHRDQYGRVKTASRVVNEEERQHRLENQDKNMEKLEWECEQRKKILKDFDRKRQNSAKNLILVESANERNRIGNIVSPKHKPNSANSRQDSQTSIQTHRSKQNRNSAKEKNETLQSNREESVRDLIVPSYNPKIYPRIWCREDLARIKSASRVVTKEERQRKFEQFEEDRERLEMESEQRKKLLQDIDKRRQLSAKKVITSDDEENSATKVLDRAFVAKQEQTEEIMKVNRLILATKVHVVRDAQITEKQEIHRQLREEELKLEKQLLNECDRAIKDEEMQREELKKLNEKYADELRIQLKRREMNKFHEAQRIEEEALAIAKVQTSINNDLRKQEQLKKDRALRMRRDLQQSNELSDFFKNMAFEEQRIAEMKAQEHMLKRKQRDLELEQERRLLREQKQREADRMLVLQAKFLQTKSEKEEIKLRLIREEKDRQYRQREKEAALKKKEIERKILTARGAQVDEAKRVRELQNAEEEEEYKKCVEKLKWEAEKERMEQERLHRTKEAYRKEIIKQIDENITKKKEKKLQIITESNVEKEKEDVRKKHLEIVIADKINAMRRANIPENLVKDVERQINLNETVKLIKQF